MHVQLKYSPFRTGFLACLLGILVTACGGGGEGRDPILGNDGNVARAPTVTTVTPAADATGVAVDIVAVTATFSEPMEAIAGDASFTLDCAAPCASPTGSIGLDAAGTTASFTLDAALERRTLYTATVTGARSRDTGLELEQSFVWSFATIGPAPTVTAVAPVNDATGVAINNQVIAAQFSEPVEALADADFTVACEAPCAAPAGSVSMNNAGTVATFNTTSALEEQTRYTATIVTATSSITGLDLRVPFVWGFTTGVTADTTNPRVRRTEPVTTDPGPTTGVPTNTAVTAAFSEDMDPLAIAGASFMLDCDAPCVAPAGAVTYVVGSRTAVFTPDEELESGTTYTATIPSTATDLAGNQLSGNQGAAGAVSDYIWTFNTEVALAADELSVQSTDPIDGGSLPFCPSASVNATFEVPSGLQMDPATVNSLTFRLVEDAAPLNVITAESVVLDQATGRIATFTPLDDLVEGVSYRATLTGGPDGVKDLAVPGNEMAEDFVWTFTAVAPVESCLEPVALDSVAPFGMFGGSAGMTNDGLLTIINGDIGTTAASTAVTGFTNGTTGCPYTITPLDNGRVNGRIFTAPGTSTDNNQCLEDGTAETQAIAQEARLDAEAAFIALSPAALPGGQDPGNDNLGGLTLEPGIYTAQSGSFLIEGSDLTLDGQGNQNAVWVFQMASTLSVGEAAIPRSVILVNGAQAKNVFWQVGTAATINPSGGGTVKGTIISNSGVSISTAGNVDIVTLDGRALSLIASVTVVNTIINVPAP